MKALFSSVVSAVLATAFSIQLAGSSSLLKMSILNTKIILQKTNYGEKLIPPGGCIVPGFTSFINGADGT